MPAKDLLQSIDRTHHHKSQRRLTQPEPLSDQITVYDQHATDSNCHAKGLLCSPTHGLMTVAFHNS